MYAYVCTCIHVFICTCICIHAYRSISTCIQRTHIDASIDTCQQIFTYIAHGHVCIRVYAHICGFLEKGCLYQVYIYTIVSKHMITQDKLTFGFSIFNLYTLQKNISNGQFLI